MYRVESLRFQVQDLGLSLKVSGTSKSGVEGFGLVRSNGMYSKGTIVRLHTHKRMHTAYTEGPEYMLYSYMEPSGD